MTIIGIGIDVIEIKRIEKIVHYFPKKFAKKILSSLEWKQYLNSNNKTAFLAKRFVVKEAATKALGTGINHGVTLKQCILYNNNYGAPKLFFLKNAFKEFKQKKCISIHVSISDQKAYAYAIVILEK